MSAFAERTQWRKKSRTSEPWVSVLRWCCCYGNRCRQLHGGHGVLKIVTTSEGCNGGEQHFKKTHKWKCAVSRRKVQQIGFCEVFGRIVCVVIADHLGFSWLLFAVRAVHFLHLCMDAALPPGTFLSICTYTAATALHFWPKHPQNTKCCWDKTENKPKPNETSGKVFF